LVPLDFPALRGRITGQATLVSLERPANFSAQASLSVSQGTIGPLHVEQGKAEVTAAEGELRVRAEGNVLGGQAAVDGRTPLVLDSPHPWEQLDFRGNLQLQQAQIAEAVQWLERREAEQLRELNGQFGGEWEIAWDASDALPSLEGRVEVQEVRWSREPLLQSGTSDFRLSPALCEIRDFQGQLGRGRVRGNLQLPLRGTGAGTLRMTATRCDVARLLAPWPDLAAQVEGTVDARVQGELGNRWRGTAELFFTRVRLADVDLRSIRLPVEWSYSPGRGVAVLRMRETSLRIAQGMAAVRGEIRWNRQLDLQLAARLSRLDLRTLFRGQAASAHIPSGRLDGQLEVTGSRVRSTRDLSGSFSGTMANAQVLRLPVLDSLIPVLGSGQVGASNFDAGDIQLSLARGRIEVQRLAFAGSAVQLLVTGHATLEGRLDLDVIAHLGQLNQRAPLARVLRASVLAAVSPAQLALLVQANEWLANRLIFARVGGTVRNPVVQLRPVATLGNEAIRFFLDEATGLSAGFQGSAP
jgi:hypothetical protein